MRHLNKSDYFQPDMLHLSYMAELHLQNPQGIYQERLLTPVFLVLKIYRSQKRLKVLTHTVQFFRLCKGRRSLSFYSHRGLHRRHQHGCNRRLFGRCLQQFLKPIGHLYTDKDSPHQNHYTFQLCLNWLKMFLLVAALHKDNPDVYRQYLDS